MEREKLKSRLGFILISAGCAIGIGNVWKFAYMAGQGGGGFFVLLYLLFLVMLGIPIMSMEFAVISQRLLKGKDGKLVLVPEVMVVDNIIAGIIRKEKISVSEIEDAIQSNSEKGSIGLINSIAELFVDDKITLEQAKAQIEEKNLEILNRTIMQLKIKKGNK